MVKTWVQLYDRLGRQPLSKTKESRIVLKNEDGTFTPLMLVFDSNGANWWLEKRKEGKDYMGKFSELDLKWYEEEDLEDLEAEYPGLFDKSREELDKFATQLYWKAQNLIEEANSLESKADVIRTYLGATEREEVL